MHLMAYREQSSYKSYLELVKGASNEFDKELFLAGEITPVFFGTALGNFGVDHMLDGLVEWAPAPMPESEIAELSEEESAAFLEDLGLEESGLTKLIKASYALPAPPDSRRHAAVYHRAARSRFRRDAGR